MGKAGNGELAAFDRAPAPITAKPRSPLRGTPEEFDQLVGGPEDAAPQVGRHDRLHRIELLGRIAARAAARK